MRLYILDTNFLLNIIRNSPTAMSAFNDHSLHEADVAFILSVVTVAEIKALSIRNKWGVQKIEIMKQFIDNSTVVDISVEDIDLIQAYVDMDVYSQFIGRKMGKNDLWIAATALVSHAVLITSDNDFDSITGIFIKTLKI